MLEKNYDLTCWYINVRRVTELLGVNSYSRPPVPDTDFLYRPFLFASIKDALLAQLRKSTPPTLEELVISDKVAVGALFTRTGQFYRTGLAKYLDAQAKSKVVPLPRVYAKLSEEYAYTRVECSYHPEHLTSTSSQVHLAGTATLSLVGAVEGVDGKTINVTPYVIASTILNIFDKGPKFLWGNRFDLTIDEIDSFNKVKDQPHPKEIELELLKNVTEEQVKNAVAEIIGEVTVDKDWGGERSDLMSDRVVVDGKRLATAFAFKGPSKFHPMKMKDLGKNGDQIDRLFTEPAKLLVLQHCHAVTSPVRGAMQAYAKNIGNPRQYCVVDGFDTLRILRAYKPELLEAKKAGPVAV